MSYRAIKSGLDARPVRFDPGQMVMTPGALEALQSNGQAPSGLVIRHIQGDWGDVPPEDARANERSLRDGARLLSGYTLGDGTRVWVITEAVDLDEPGTRPDRRELTTLLLPEEY
jgi:hypothetical protein